MPLVNELAVSKLRKNLRKELEAQGTTLSAFKDAHYNRNILQPEYVSYFDLLQAKDEEGGWKYTLMSEASSAFHKLNRNGETDNALNSKWVSTDGLEEFVYKYVGSDLDGQFAMLSLDAELAGKSDVHLSHLNVGTYNFQPASMKLLHFKLDIVPWILWGNSAVDAQRWTDDERWAAFTAAGPSKVYETVKDAARDWEVMNVPLHALVKAEEVQAGGSGDDMLAGTAKAEKFRGKLGVDTADYGAAPSAVTASLVRGDGFDGWARGDRYFGVENLQGSIFGDILIGDGGENSLFGGDGADILAGRGGADLIDGGAGANTLFGGGGDDRFLVSNTRTEVHGDFGVDTLVSSMASLSIGGHSRFSGVEVYQLTTDAVFAIRARTLYGSDRGETLVGNSYDNTLFGNDGIDLLFGGGGNDDLEGGKSNDTYVFDADWGVDVIAEEGGRDTIEFLSHALGDLRLARDIGVNSGFLNIFSEATDDALHVWNQFNGSKKLRLETLLTTDGELNLRRGLPLTGTDAYDAMQGTGYSDLIDTAGGDDFIYAGGGRDTLIGGEGDDVLWGEAGNDTYIFRSGFGHDTVTEAGAYQGEKDSSGDTLAFYGIGYADVRQSEFSGAVTVSVLGIGGAVTDSIHIRSQSYNHGDGLLVEWVSFDGGAAMPFSALMEMA